MNIDSESGKTVGLFEKTCNAIIEKCSFLIKRIKPVLKGESADS